MSDTPLFEGTVDQAWVDRDENHRPHWTILAVTGSIPNPERLDGCRVVVYPALDAAKAG